jgi:hypothetical protein
MAELTALVGTPDSLRSDGGSRPLVQLAQGYLLAPVDEAAWDEIGAALAGDPGLAADLTRFLALLLRGAGVRAEGSGRFAYLEVDEFKQAAIIGAGATVVDSYTTELDGTQARKPRHDWAVNRALRQIGVRTDGAADECAGIRC